MNIVTLTLSGTKVLYRKEHHSLLVALEEHQINVEYQCREGYCGSCRCRLIAGQINWLIKPMAVIGNDEILLCCCQAKGDIKIEI